MSSNAVRVVFFARIREELGSAGAEVNLADAGADTASLIAYLARQHGEHWADVLAAENVICAVNHEVVEGSAALVGGEEVAFFPPVTGG